MCVQGCSTWPTLLPPPRTSDPSPGRSGRKMDKAAREQVTVLGETWRSLPGEHGLSPWHRCRSHWRRGRPASGVIPLLPLLPSAPWPGTWPGGGKWVLAQPPAGSAQYAPGSTEHLGPPLIKAGAQPPAAAGGDLGPQDGESRANVQCCLYCRADTEQVLRTSTGSVDPSQGRAGRTAGPNPGGRAPAEPRHKALCPGESDALSCWHLSEADTGLGQAQSVGSEGETQTA